LRRIFLGGISATYPKKKPPEFRRPKIHFWRFAAASFLRSKAAYAFFVFFDTGLPASARWIVCSDKLNSSAISSCESLSRKLRHQAPLIGSAGFRPERFAFLDGGAG
jgi:hypothetical protein